MHEVLVNRLGGLSLPRKSVVRLTDRPDMTLDVYRGHKTTIQHRDKITPFSIMELDKNHHSVALTNIRRRLIGYLQKFATVYSAIKCRKPVIIGCHQV